MIRRPPKPSVLIPIHARLARSDHERLVAVADRQDSSVARIIKLAVIEYLDRHTRDLGPDKLIRSNKQG